MDAGKYNEGLRMGTIHEMSRLVRLCLYIIVLCTIGFSVDAQTTIGTACPTVGWITLQPNQIIYCNTSNLWSLGEEITSTGFVGIGTTTPMFRLHMVAPNSTYGTTVAIDTIGTGQQAFISYYEQGSQYWQLGKNVDESLLIYDAKANRTDFQIYSNGNMSLMGAGGYVGIGTTAPITSLDLSQKTDALALPSGTTAQRPGSPVNGMLRYNATSTPTVEAYVNGAWTALGGASGASSATLGTTVTVTNPQRSGDPTTGFFSATAGTVSVSSLGIDTGDFASSGLNLPGVAMSYKLNGNNAVWQDNTNHNLAVGPTALPSALSQSGGGSSGQSNTGLGSQALNANTTGYGNTAIGSLALPSNTTGTQNTAAGSGSLAANISGSTNTAFGYAALGANTASNNTAVGAYALTSNTTGTQNTALGMYSLHQNTAGGYSTAVGFGALYSNSTGVGNVALGDYALVGNMTGSGNVALGDDTLYSNTTGSNNTAIGNGVALLTLSTGSNNILIGTSDAVDTLTPGTNYNLNIGNLMQGDMTNSTSLGNEALYLQSVPSSVDYLQVAGSASGPGSSILVSGQGVDSNINIALLPKGAGNVGVGTASPADSLDIGNRNDAITLPIGSISQRPGSPVNGMIRYNSTTPTLEAYVNGAWTSLGSGGSGSGNLGTSASVTSPQRTGDATTGLYSSAAGKVDVASSGTQIMDLSSTGLAVVQGTLTIGVPNTTLGHLLLEGSSSGAVTFVPQAAAGTPTVTFGTASGTPAVTATAPLSITAATGNIAISGVAGQIPNGITGAFTATPALGINATTTGQLIFANGGASGASVTLQNNGATTAYNFNLPTTAGAKGSLLASGGGGATANTWIADTAAGKVLISQTATTNPAYSSTPTLGVAGTTLGTLALAGNTSGTVTIQPAAAAGTWSLTLPTSAGTNGYVLTTNGSGVSSWASASATLGASSTTTNPSVSGDATTGLFSPAGATVAVAVTGAEKIRVNSTGVGIGTTAPATVLHVNGEILAGSTSVACSSTVQGALRYSSAANALQFCDGTNWGNLPSSSCTSSAPAGFVFTNQTGAAVSTLTTSNIVQITGITCNVTTQISGSGSPQYRVCSDSACSTVLTNWTSSSATAANNQYVQLRLTSSNGGSTATTATLSVGSNSTSWTVTTQGYCTGANPTPGTICSDGTMYAGVDAGNIPMYTTPCDNGQTYSGGSCTGTRSNYSWNNGNNSGGTSTGATSTSNGFSNTSTLTALNDSDSPYRAASACHTLNFGGHTDWFLPAQNQFQTLLAYNYASLTSNGYYWSSTESSTSQAVSFQATSNSAPIGPAGKYNVAGARCIRETGGASPGCGTHSGTITAQTQQTVTVPAGCAVTFKAWGAGGGGNSDYSTTGAAGGYATISISAGSTDVTYYLATGGGGAYSPGYSGGAGGAGTSGYTGGTGSGYGSGGGGASGVWTGGYGSGGTPVIVAGGGSGIGYTTYSAANGPGCSSSAPQNSSTVGASDSSNSFAGGGAGYPTGGAVGTANYGYGSGGSCYAPSGGGTAAGSGATPGDAGDANYPSGAGIGGASANGANGAIYYSY